MGKYYKREVSLMNKKIFPRASLDISIHNPDPENSIEAKLLDEKSDQEIINNVVSDFRRIGTEQCASI